MLFAWAPPVSARSACASTMHGRASRRWRRRCSKQFGLTRHHLRDPRPDHRGRRRRLAVRDLVRARSAARFGHHRRAVAHRLALAHLLRRRRPRISCSPATTRRRCSTGRSSPRRRRSRSSRRPISAPRSTPCARGCRMAAACWSRRTSTRAASIWSRAKAAPRSSRDRLAGAAQRDRRVSAAPRRDRERTTSRSARSKTSWRAAARSSTSASRRSRSRTSACRGAFPARGPRRCSSASVTSPRLPTGCAVMHAVHAGDDPYWLKRLPNHYITRLPGRGRQVLVFMTSGRFSRRCRRRHRLPQQPRDAAARRSPRSTRPAVRASAIARRRRRQHRRHRRLAARGAIPAVRVRTLDRNDGPNPGPQRRHPGDAAALRAS